MRCRCSICSFRIEAANDNANDGRDEQDHGHKMPERRNHRAINDSVVSASGVCR